MFAFDGRQFKRLVGISDAEAQKILKVIEGAYVAASKHSDALIGTNYFTQKLAKTYKRTMSVVSLSHLKTYSSTAAI